MKHVFDSSEIPHLWAHQRQDSARNQQGNLYFEGETIYSYGDHFPIARWVEYKGRRAVLFTTGGYSSTTAKHIGAVRCAIPHGTLVLRVDDPGRTTRESGKKEHIENVTRAGKEVAESRRGRSREKRQEAYAVAVAHANKYFEFYGYTRRYPECSAEEIATIHAAEVERERKRNAAAVKKAIAKFRAGEINYIRPEHGSHLLRVLPDNETVVTSLGVTVPMSHVKRALPLVLKLIAEKRTYQHNGHSIHIGHYVIDQIDAKGTLTAGCHRINKAEIERFAAEVVKS